MKKVLVLMMSVVLTAAVFAGCGESEERKLIEFTEKYIFAGTGETDGFEYVVYDDHSEIIAYNIADDAETVEFPSRLGGKPVTAIEGGILKDNTLIRSVTIPGTVRSIGNYAFSGCTSLVSVTIPGSVEKLGCGVCLNTPWYESLTGEFVTVGDGVLIKYGGDGGNVKIPDNVKYISNAFEGNMKISTVDIPDSVVGICDYAFYDCNSLTEINIPEEIYDIGNGAFEGTTWFMAEDGDYITVGNSVLIDYRGNSAEVRIPDGIKYVSGAFYGNTEIVSVQVPASVILVKRGSFYGCTGLDSVVFDGNDTYIESNTFYDCEKLTSVKLPANMSVLNSYMFMNCTRLSAISLPDGIKYLGTMVFYNCGVLESVDMPSAVTDIGKGAFFGCAKLKSIELPQTVTKLGIMAFGCCYELESVELPPALSDIPDGLFSYCKKMAEVTLTDRIKSVGQYAFEACDNIRVYIPSEFTALSENSFYECEGTAEIFCREGSPAESFAKEYNIKYTIY